MEHVKQTALRFLELRSKATQGHWDDQPASEEWKANKINNAEFCRQSANHIESIIKWALDMEKETEKLKQLLTQVDKYGKEKLLTELENEVEMLEAKLENARSSVILSLKITAGVKNGKINLDLFLKLNLS